MNSPFTLEEKTILVTGASSGIGKETAIQISNNKASSCIIIGRDHKALEETASKFNSNCTPVILSYDLTDFTQFNQLEQSIPELDGIVLNAGINNPKLLKFASEKDLEKIFDINFYSPVLLIHHLLKKKKIKKGASIVFISSISGLTNFALGNGIYGSSKSALTSYMKYLAVELAPKKIRCNSIHPGRIQTPFIDKIKLDQEALEKDIQQYPLKRYGKPEEIAYAVIYLLSEASSWVTGINLTIDGGRSLV